MNIKTKVRALSTLGVAAGTVTATVGVLTNPFKAKRKSARQYFNRTIITTVGWTLQQDVVECPACNAENPHMDHLSWTNTYKKGDYINYSISSETRHRQHDSHCPTHLPLVKNYNWRMRRTEED